MKAVGAENPAALAPTVLRALVHKYGHFESAEDAVQEALVAATIQWPVDGHPKDETAWLIRVASRRLIDFTRSEQARTARETRAVQASLRAENPSSIDDTLFVLMMCSHPSLTVGSQLALTLRAVGGLTTSEVAHAFFVSEAAMAQRISRAKAAIARSDTPFTMPDDDQVEARIATVRRVLYVMYTEGHFASFGTNIQRRDLAAEAIRLTRMLYAYRENDSESAGLLALLVLNDARRDAFNKNGNLVRLGEQDRTLWDRGQIAEGTSLIEMTLRASKALGPYQIHAAIAAIHSEAESTTQTDWAQIVALYDLLDAIEPNPMTTLSRAIALGEIAGPMAGLALLDTLKTNPRLKAHHRLQGARGFLFERAGEMLPARDAYTEAARLATNIMEQRFFRQRAQRCVR